MEQISQMNGLQVIISQDKLQWESFRKYPLQLQVRGFHVPLNQLLLCQILTRTSRGFPETLVFHPFTVPNCNGMIFPAWDSMRVSAISLRTVSGNCAGFPWLYGSSSSVEASIATGGKARLMFASRRPHAGSGRWQGLSAALTT